MIDRRKFFLGAGAVLAGAAGAVAWLTRRPSGEAPAAGHDHHAAEAPRAGKIVQAEDSSTGPLFPERYRASLEALTLRLVLDEPGFAGGGATQAYAYIERELRRSDMNNQRTLALRGAVVLDRVSQQKTGQVFVKVKPADQDLVIDAVVAGDGDGERFRGRDFVHMMLALTLEGTYGDPAHGGNKDEAGWKAIAWVAQTPRPAAR